MKASRDYTRIAAFSAYYGDRADSFDEAVACDPDVLIGDYLAELTMLVLSKVGTKGGPKYAAGFVRDLEPRLSEIARRGCKIVTNAGGLDPIQCGSAVTALVKRLNLDLRVAVITGDDLVGRIAELQEEGQTFAHLDTGDALAVSPPQILTANAYLGAWPIVDALRRGADIVICPRVTDASLAIGPAAWRHGWAIDDFDKLAGGLAAGHLIECGSQVTGGNFSFFEEVDYTRLPGVPFADIYEDGSFEIGKAPSTGGVVNLDTVKAQMVYEVGGPLYHNPDVILDIRSLKLEQRGLDVVRVSGCRGLMPTSMLKVSLCYPGGYRNSMGIGLTGRNIKKKAALIDQIIEYRLGSKHYEEITTSLIGPSSTGTGSYESNTAWYMVSVRDRDKNKVGREGFSNVLVSSVMAAMPGGYFTVPPQSEKSIAIQWPCLIEKRFVSCRVIFEGKTAEVGWGREFSTWPVSAGENIERRPYAWSQKSSSVQLGELFGARSGDKGGIANLGVWARDDRYWNWLSNWLTVERLKELLPEARNLRVDRHLFPNLFAINFLLFDFLGDGVAACLRVDPQAKGLGEYLLAQVAEVPQEILNVTDEPAEVVHHG